MISLPVVNSSLDAFCVSLNFSSARSTSDLGAAATTGGDGAATGGDGAATGSAGAWICATTGFFGFDDGCARLGLPTSMSGKASCAMAAPAVTAASSASVEI